MASIKSVTNMQQNATSILCLVKSAHCLWYLRLKLNLAEFVWRRQTDSWPRTLLHRCIPYNCRNIASSLGPDFSEAQISRVCSLTSPKILNTLVLIQYAMVHTKVAVKTSLIPQSWSTIQTDIPPLAGEQLTRATNLFSATFPVASWTFIVALPVRRQIPATKDPDRIITSPEQSPVLIQGKESDTVDSRSE